MLDLGWTRAACHRHCHGICDRSKDCPSCFAKWVISLVGPRAWHENFRVRYGSGGSKLVWMMCKSRSKLRPTPKNGHGSNESYGVTEFEACNPLKDNKEKSEQRRQTRKKSQRPRANVRHQKRRPKGRDEAGTSRPIAASSKKTHSPLPKQPVKDNTTDEKHERSRRD